MDQKKVIIVDDSALMRRVLSDIITSDERLTVSAMAANGVEALDLILAAPSKFDMIILDINMPKMNGIEFMEELEKKNIRIKIIIVSTYAKEGREETVRALELGAFDFVTKPDSFSEAKGDGFAKKVLSRIEYALGLKQDSGQEIRQVLSQTSSTQKKNHVAVNSNAKKIVALACSTGGPRALQEVIPRLPANLDAPVVLVQHMPKGFTESLSTRLNEISKISVKEAADGDILEKGKVYIAKGGCHMRVVKRGSDYALKLLPDEPARGGLKPCADIMYESLMDSDYDDIICVVLTGMGGDGTLGIKQLNNRKNIYVIAQNEETSTVYGMPRVIYEAGLTDEVLPLEKIADAITKNVGVR